VDGPERVVVVLADGNLDLGGLVADGQLRGDVLVDVRAVVHRLQFPVVV